MARVIPLGGCRQDDWLDRQHGKLLDRRHFDRVYAAADGELDLVRPGGSLLAAWRPGALPGWAWRGVLRSALPAARWSNHRGGHSGTAGSFDEPRPRVTAFTRDRPREWLALLPLLGEMNRVHTAAAPDAYAAQARAAGVTHPYWRIPGTAATTLTVNKNWWSPVHPDGGNLRRSMSALTVLERGAYAGAELIFLRWGVAFDVRTGDVLVADFATEPHGNAPFDRAGGFVRVSLVLYFRAGLRGAPPPR